ncbi:Pc12g14970 [Sugiyamaella lignohabitans]|uniref:Pc12g14970 n=1 Tax=Sugiyamaella lignohabitans TaxID=796027 RepID=A0A167CRM4_9ASCO|nr:Pc12g14970 [Sugiyamaella lignohabitans]ANB12026.1 Pc12g14970 [Sugiyamaella lignohabitans]
MGQVKTLEDLPSYNQLPNKQRFWEWGPPGSHEEGLGKQNLLTPEHVAKSAKSEIKTGDRIGLGWEMHKLEYPAFGRKHFDLKIDARSEFSLDDIYEFNPQQSSQWDGFRHYQQPVAFSGADEDKQKGKVDGLWFGGASRSEITEKGSTRIGVHHWAQQGIVGRGVLIDYATYAEEKGIKYSCFEPNIITHADLQGAIKRFNVDIQPADIVFIRIGLPREWDKYSDEEKKAIQERPPEFMGLEPSQDNLSWIWDNHFPAVASDAIALEVLPKGGYPNGLPMHQHLLAGWGVTIGEIFNLEPLAELCKKLNRYSFFVASVPLNAVGAVSTPPNAVAIF